MKIKVIDKSDEEVNDNFFVSVEGKLYLWCDMTGELINVDDKFRYFWLG